MKKKIVKNVMKQNAKHVRQIKTIVIHAKLENILLKKIILVKIVMRIAKLASMDQVMEVIIVFLVKVILNINILKKMTIIQLV
jgi:hypothetical protein